MGCQHILQKNGLLPTEIAILNLERMAHWNFNLLVKMENGPYYGLPTPITDTYKIQNGNFQATSRQSHTKEYWAINVSPIAC